MFFLYLSSNVLLNLISHFMVNESMDDTRATLPQFVRYSIFGCGKMHFHTVECDRNCNSIIFLFIYYGLFVK